MSDTSYDRLPSRAVTPELASAAATEREKVAVAAPYAASVLIHVHGVVPVGESVTTPDTAMQMAAQAVQPAIGEGAQSDAEQAARALVREAVGE